MADLDTDEQLEKRARSMDCSGSVAVLLSNAKRNSGALSSRRKAMRRQVGVAEMADLDLTWRYPSQYVPLILLSSIGPSRENAVEERQNCGYMGGWYPAHAVKHAVNAPSPKPHSSASGTCSCARMLNSATACSSAVASTISQLSCLSNSSSLSSSVDQSSSELIPPLLTGTARLSGSTTVHTSPISSSTSEAKESLDDCLSLSLSLEASPLLLDRRRSALSSAAVSSAAILLMSS
mmetsp:Transcript_4435/g.15576  ORF Transcript_4435/g.15576 Transcript_4435/m.15576 type:complete len:236 (-) Transcript_4435:1386-2093(-)